MAAIISILMALTVVVVLSYPFLKRRVGSPEPSDRIEWVGSADTLRHLLYREPATLRNEYEAGNVTAEEFEEQLQEIRLQAAALMHQRDERRYQIIEAELAIEREVQQIRKSRLADSSDDTSETA